MNVKDILNQIGEGVLKEDSVKLLTDAFTEAVTTQVNEKVQLEVQSALQKLDEEHATKLQKLIESIDENHSNKLMVLVDKIDRDHFSKLQHVIESYKKALNEDSKQFKNELVNNISKYMDLYLDKAIPKDQIAEAVSNKKAQKILDDIKQVVSLDEEFITSTIAEAVEDGKNTIDTLKQELNEAIQNNIKIGQELKTTQTSLLIETNVKNFSKDKKDYVMRVLRGKDPEYIKENIEHVVKMFDKDNEEKSELVAEAAKEKSKAIKTDTPKTVISESTINPSPLATSDSGVKSYLGAMTNMDE